MLEEARESNKDTDTENMRRSCTPHSPVISLHSNRKSDPSQEPQLSSIITLYGVPFPSRNSAPEMGLLVQRIVST